MYALKNEVKNLKCGALQIALQLSQNSYGQEFMHKLYWKIIQMHLAWELFGKVH